MIFLYPRLGLSSDINPGYSMGLGARHYIASIDAIIGGNIFYDRYDSNGGNYYDQLGLGLEVLTRWVDARFNYYIPDSSQNVIDKRKTRSRSQSTSSSWGQPFATGYTIRQPYSTTTTTTNQLFERFEDTMEGFDAEVGVLTPWLEQYVALRWFAGYYNFNNRYGADLNGVKARAELRFSSKLAVDATYYQDQEVTGSNWLFGFRVNIPIYMENLSQGRSPFEGSFSGMFDGVNLGGRSQGKRGIQRGGVGSTYPSSYAPSPFAAMAPAPTFASASSGGSTVRDRMTEEVLRLSGARTSESDFIENLAKRDVDVDIDEVTRIVVIEDSIVFVSNARCTMAGPGTFENPLNTIQGGVNRASVLFANRGDVFVSGTGTQYVEDVVDAGSSVKLWGGAKGVPVNGGRRFTHGSQPVLNGGFQIADVPLFSLSGFTIINGFAGGDGVQLADVANIAIMDNKISNVGSRGIEIDNDAVMNSVIINITNNIINGTNDEGLEVDVDVAGGSVALTITGNQFLNAGDMGASIELDVNDGGKATAVISNNRIVNSSDEGLEFDASISDGSVLMATISGNVIDMAGDDGLDIDASFDQSGASSLLIFGNRISNSGSNGFDLIFDTFGPLVTPQVMITGNSFLNNGSSSINLGSDDGGAQINYSGTGNTSSGAGSGLSLEDDDTTGATGSIEINGTTIGFPSPGDIPE